MIGPKLINLIHCTGHVSDEWRQNFHKSGADGVDYVRKDLHDALRSSQSYTYIGEDGKPRQARDMEDEIDALRAALKKGVRVLDRIEELNLLQTDENGHRWCNSDLIGQEVMAARAALAEDAA